MVVEPAGNAGEQISCDSGNSPRTTHTANLRAGQPPLSIPEALLYILPYAPQPRSLTAHGFQLSSLTPAHVLTPNQDVFLSCILAGGARTEEAEEGVHACIPSGVTGDERSDGFIPYTAGYLLFLPASFFLPL